jgi:hypothetical protein
MWELTTRQSVTSLHSFESTSIRSDGTISTWSEFGKRQQAQPRVLNGGFRLDVATTPLSGFYRFVTIPKHAFWQRALLVQPAFAQLRIHEMPNESSHMPNRPKGISLGGTVTLPSCESAVNNFSSSLFELQSMNTEKLLP